VLLFDFRVDHLELGFPANDYVTILLPSSMNWTMAEVKPTAARASAIGFGGASQHLSPIR
jgi:hypothetical protein